MKQVFVKKDPSLELNFIDFPICKDSKTTELSDILQDHPAILRLYFGHVSLSFTPEPKSRKINIYAY